MVKLVIGKTYVDGYGRLVRIVAIRRGATGSADYIGIVGHKNEVEYTQYYYENGTQVTTYDNKTYIVKEYKEPVVHKKDIVWLRATSRGSYSTAGTLCHFVTDVGAKYPHPDVFTEVHRQTVEYIEEE